MLVKATDMSSKKGVKIKELRRIAIEGEEFEVTPLRFKVLSGENRYRTVFVKKVEEKKTKSKPKNDTVVATKVNEEQNVKEEVKEEQVEEVNEEVKEEVEVVEEKQKPKKRSRKKKEVINVE